LYRFYSFSFYYVTINENERSHRTTKQGENKVQLQMERKEEIGELAGSIMRLSSDLERLKNDRNEFMVSISHERRTPLTYIKVYADIISKQDITDEERKEYLDIIREETEHLTVLVKNLFDLAKMDENKFVINRKSVSLR